MTPKIRHDYEQKTGFWNTYAQNLFYDKKVESCGPLVL